MGRDNTEVAGCNIGQTLAGREGQRRVCEQAGHDAKRALHELHQGPLARDFDPGAVFLQGSCFGVADREGDVGRNVPSHAPSLRRSRCDEERGFAVRRLYFVLLLRPGLFQLPRLALRVGSLEAAGYAAKRSAFRGALCRPRCRIGERAFFGCERYRFSFAHLVGMLPAVALRPSLPRCTVVRRRLRDPSETAEAAGCREGAGG